MKSSFTFSLLGLAIPSTLAWDYKQAGADWGSTADICESGKSQTPINLPIDGSGDNHKYSEAAEMMAWTTSYDSLSRDQLKEVSVDGYLKTYQMDLPNGGNLAFTDKDGVVSNWELQQFHHHSPSEHRYDGDQRSLELHFVHYSNTGSISADALAVLSVSFELSEDGTANEWLSMFMDGDEAKLGSNISSSEFNTWINSLNTGNFYNYMGSLTTPDCNEIVNWIVVQDAQMASQAQLNAFEAAFSGDDYLDGNAREQQKVNGRTIYMKTRPSFASSIGLTAAAALGATLSFL